MDSSLDLGNVLVSGGNRVADTGNNGLEIVRATGKEINRGQLLFWPGMDTHMRFGQQQNARYTVWLELIEAFTDNLKATYSCCFAQEFLPKRNIHQRLVFGQPKVIQNVSPL